MNENWFYQHTTNTVNTFNMDAPSLREVIKVNLDIGETQIIEVNSSTRIVIRCAFNGEITMKTQHAEARWVDDDSE